MRAWSSLRAATISSAQATEDALLDEIERFPATGQRTHRPVDFGSTLCVLFTESWAGPRGRLRWATAGGGMFSSATTRQANR